MATNNTLLSYCIVSVSLLLLACSQVKAFFCSEEGAIRLADGPSPREGRVDICLSGYWLTPCQDSWGIEETQVVCRELGFCQQGGQNISGENYQYNYPLTLIEVNCTGGEDTLSNCSVGASYGEYVGAGVSCNSTTPGSPTNVEITASDRNSFLVSWSPPDMSDCTDVDSYIVECYDYPFIDNFYFREVSGYTRNVSFTVIGYFSYNYFTFYCNVQSNNSAGRSYSNSVEGPIPDPVKNVSVLESMKSILLLEWYQPLVFGRFDQYSIVCGTQYRYVYNISQTTVNITGLTPFTRYECCVQTYTYFTSSNPTCVNATTAPDLPTAPLEVNITGVTSTLVQLEWSRPQPVNGIIFYYTITCYQDSDDSTGTAINSESVTIIKLLPLTNYTCCVSATNQVGQGNETCVETRTKIAPPTEPQQVATVSTLTTSVRLTWSEPAESYGEVVLFYTVNCTSPTLHTVIVERVYNTTVSVMGLHPGSNYTCCVSASSSIGVGQQECTSVTTNKAALVGSDANMQVGIAVTAGVLSSMLMILVVVVLSIFCYCCHKRRTSKQTLNGQATKSSENPVYDIPEDIALKQASKPSQSAPQNNERQSHRQEYKEDVEIRYKKPALTSHVEASTNTRTNKMPLAPPSHAPFNPPSNQTEEERVYQPLVPAKTYKGPQETSAYQDLAFETREPKGGVVNNSEYEMVQHTKGVSAYKPLSFGGGGREEGQYQPLTFRGEESNIYEHPQPTPT